MLQPLSTSVGAVGAGMGFAGVQPSIGIALDTWQNADIADPAFDHISIQANGNAQHGNDLAAPVAISTSSDNVEDCQWHLLRITWEPASKKIQAYFDGVLRVQSEKDIIKDIFNNDPEVFWGFSGATGGSVNLQQFCTALNPKFETNDVDNALCIGTPITFQDKSESFAPITDYYWDFGDGTTSLEVNPVPHLYAQPGNYTVKQVITGADGCISDTLKTDILVGSYPDADFEVFDTCDKLNPRIEDRSDAAYGAVTAWKWSLDGADVPESSPYPVLDAGPGIHNLSLSVSTNAGCASSEVSKTFSIHEVPVIEARVEDACIGQSINFEGTQIDNKTTIHQWQWNFNEGTGAATSFTEHSFSTSGIKTAHLRANATNGCFSEISKTLLINEVKAFAGTDSIVAKSDIFSLNGSAQQAGTKPLSYIWQPAVILDNANSPQPTLSLEDDQVFTLTVISEEGCEATDDVKITVFKGSAIYVPNAFTPNNDSRNDLLRPRYLGIKKLMYFSVYNRWGQLVFTTNDLSKAWDGTSNGTVLTTGTFVWMIKAEDFIGNQLQLKGTATIIR